MGSSAAAAITERAVTKQVRAVHTFTFPPSVATDKVQSVGIGELTANEEIQAAKRVGTDQARLPYELSLQCLAEVNGEPVSLGDGSADTAWQAMSAKQRTLVIAGYGEVNAPEQEDLSGFLKSQQVKVG